MTEDKTSQNDTENLELQENKEGENLENQTDNTEGGSEELSEGDKTLLAQKDHWRKKAEGAQALADELKQKLEQATKGEEGGEDTPPEPNGQPSFVEQAREFQAVKDLDDKQLAYVEMLTKANGVSPSKAVQSDEFQFWNTSYKAKVESEQTTPEPSSRQSGEGSSEVSKMTAAEVAKLPPKDPRREEWTKLQTQ